MVEDVENWPFSFLKRWISWSTWFGPWVLRWFFLQKRKHCWYHWNIFQKPRRMFGEDNMGGRINSNEVCWIYGWYEKIVVNQHVLTGNSIDVAEVHLHMYKQKTASSVFFHLPKTYSCTCLPYYYPISYSRLSPFNAQLLPFFLGEKSQSSWVIGFHPSAMNKSLRFFGD